MFMNTCGSDTAGCSRTRADLSSNKLAVLPRGMRALRALVRLDLRYNVLVTAPDLSNAARLKVGGQVI